MKCFYHGDGDGKCAAAIVYKASLGSMDRSDFYEVDYGRPFPWDVVAQEEKVIIVDWSLNEIPNGWEKLIARCGGENITWIDHHKTAIEGCMYEFAGIRNTQAAGCELTWAHFFPTKPMPRYVKLVGDYDTWKFKYGRESLCMSYMLLLHDDHPCSILWELVEDPKSLEEFLQDGSVVVEYKKKQAEDTTNRLAYITNFEGYKCVAVNTLGGSKVLDSIKEDHDIRIIYQHRGDNYKVSLYRNKDNIDCSAVATKHGGGGHPGAAGFICTTLPFIKTGDLSEF